jgi:Na+/H+-dicarboxylate symporter
VNILKFITQLPVKLTLAILAAALLGKVLDLSTVSFFYTISCCFIELLLFFLPLMVFTFIFRALLAMPQGSLLLLLKIFAGVTLSNCLALFTAYICGKLFLPLLGITSSPDFAAAFAYKVHPLFELQLPVFLGTEQALIIGIISGLVLARVKPESRFRGVFEGVSLRLHKAVSLFLDAIFIPFLPLYVFSFCLKFCYEGALWVLFEQYGKVFILSIALLVCYILFLYILAAKGSWKEARSSIVAMMPAGLTGFSTMSSAATMPVTIACVEQTTGNKQLTNLLIPATTNIHMLGDDLTLMITSMTLLSVFGVPWPDLANFLPFALAFSLAKLSCVGIPGASVLVVLPVLQSYLGFTPEMISIVTTIYVLQDPFGTAANVMGNGAFALLMKSHFFTCQNNNNLK